MSLLFAALAGAVLASNPGANAPHEVIELRQYKMATGQRDPFVELFERELVETQEAEGMELIGQFRDRADPDRFTWIRAFPDMATRQKALTAFYSGPAWLAHRGTANPMLADNDNVLLLRPAKPDWGFEPGTARPAGETAAPARLVIVTIHYLWKQPSEGFIAFFEGRLVPALRRAGLPLEAALVREETANNFPRLPVREGEKLFIWTTAADSESAWKSALARLERDPEWPAIRAGLDDLEERPHQRLLLDPTPRSKLR